MLHIQNLSLTYPGADVPALDQVGFTLNAGDFCVLLGSNGSGKSTLLRVIMGDLTPQSGQIFLGGRDITSLPPYARAKWVSAVTQDVAAGTAGALTLLENLALGAARGKGASWGLYAQERATLKAAICAFDLDWEAYGDRPLSGLSGGQRQRVALAIATLKTPELLLLDEHCSALDPRTQKEVMTATGEMIAACGMTTLMITHNLEDALHYGNRLMVMRAGRLVLDVEGASKIALTSAHLMALFHPELQEEAR